MTQYGAKERPVTVVLVDVGKEPEMVVRLLRQTLSLTITDTTALADATPLVLFENLELQEAIRLEVLFRQSGARVELFLPRVRRQGLGRPTTGRRRAA